MSLLPINQSGLEPVPAKVNRSYEYVTGGNSGGWNWLQTLPTPDDDLENLIGNDVYTRMGNDEQIQASTMLLIMMALRRPMTFDPAFADLDENDADFLKGLEVRDAFQRAIDNLGRHRSSLFKFHFEMLYNAMRFGAGVAEKTYERGTGEDANREVFKYLKVKRRETVPFVVDYFFNHLGFAVYNGPYLGWLGEMKRVLTNSEGGTMAGSDTMAQKTKVKQGEEEKEVPLWEFIPREKFAVLSLLTENNDPRGRSWWRCIYNAWFQKMNRLRQLNLYMERFGLPIPIGTVSDSATDQYPLNGVGEEDKTRDKVSPQVGLLQALVNMRSGDALALPHGTEVELIQNTNDGGSLMNSLHYHDSQMVKGITFQKLATSPDAHQAKASGEVHQDVLNTPVHYLKNEVVEMDMQDLVIPWVEVNYGPGSRKYAPRPNLGRTDPEDLARLLTALGTAFEKGGLHWSMLPEIWADWGLPRVDVKAWMEEMRTARAGNSEVVPTGNQLPADPAKTIASAATKAAKFSWRRLFGLGPKPIQFTKEQLSEAASESPCTIDNILAHMPEEYREFGRAMLQQMVAQNKES